MVGRLRRSFLRYPDDHAGKHRTAKACGMIVTEYSSDDGSEDTDSRGNARFSIDPIAPSPQGKHTSSDQVLHQVVKNHWDDDARVRGEGQ